MTTTGTQEAPGEAVRPGVSPQTKTLGEARTGKQQESGGKELDYGRIRLWGSLSFMATAVGAGHVLAGRDPGIIYWAPLKIRHWLKVG